LRVAFVCAGICVSNVGACTQAAKAAGVKIITWTLERSGPLGGGGGWYYGTSLSLTNNDGDKFELLHVLHKDVGVVGVFSDWPATTTFYANCVISKTVCKVFLFLFALLSFMINLVLFALRVLFYYFSRRVQLADASSAFPAYGYGHA